MVWFKSDGKRLATWDLRSDDEDDDDEAPEEGLKDPGMVLSGQQPIPLRG